MKSHIEIGTRFGSWEVIGGMVREKRAGSPGAQANYIILYLCKCDCGTERLVRAFKLLSNSGSCGCRQKEFSRAKHVTHGESGSNKSRLYQTWDGMVQRCTNKRHQGYKDYGGRGIFMCNEWRESYIAFRDWALANGFASNLQIDRFDNDGGYSPANCHWVSEAQNKRNTRQNIFVTAFGEAKCLTDWALDPRCSVSPQTIKYRISAGLSTEEAITQPRRTRRSSPEFKGNHL